MDAAEHLQWIDSTLYTTVGTRLVPSREVLMLAEQVLHIRWNWAAGEHSARSSAMDMVAQDGERGLDLLDFLVARASVAKANELNGILTRSGSLWEVRRSPGPSDYELVRRAIGPVPAAIQDVRPISERAHVHLMTAWSRLMGRNPDPSSA